MKVKRIIMIIAIIVVYFFVYKAWILLMNTDTKSLVDYSTHKIEEYKNNLIERLKIQPLDIKVCFLVEDKTVFGTHYLSNNNSYGEPVVLTDTLQFQGTINNSNVDYIISGREQDQISCIGCKGDSEQDKIDLLKKEFFVIPAIPLFTASKKTQLP